MSVFCRGTGMQLLNMLDVVAAHQPWLTDTFHSFDITFLVDVLQNSVQSNQQPLLCRKFCVETLSTILFVFTLKFSCNFIFFGKNIRLLSQHINRG